MNTKMVKRTQFNISAQDVKIYYNQIKLSTLHIKNNGNRSYTYALCKKSQLMETYKVIHHCKTLLTFLREFKY